MISFHFILALDISYCVCVFIYRLTQADSFGARTSAVQNERVVGGVRISLLMGCQGNTECTEERKVQEIKERV